MVQEDLVYLWWGLLVDSFKNGRKAWEGESTAGKLP